MKLSSCFINTRQDSFWEKELWCRTVLTSASDGRECLALRPLILVHIGDEWRPGRFGSGDEKTNKVQIN